MAQRKKVPDYPYGRRVSQEESEVEYKYGSIRILRDGRVRFSARTVLGLPELSFSVHYGAGAGDAHVWDRANYSVNAHRPEKRSFLFLYTSHYRVQSACFNFSSTPDEMRKAVALLRKAGGGIERWIIPGLEHTRNSIAGLMAGRSPTEYDQPGLALLAVIDELLKENRDLPIAEPWTRQKRERERWERQQAKKAAAGRKPRKITSAKAPRKRRTA
ncbi:MAG TPA: hypothetical protein VK447_14060 [Myxococcaceae bacterium]|nr:hypothetical protein [Myxococcaceae bacterium]